jgi:flagellar basal-body rod protein FlgC
MSRVDGDKTPFNSVYEPGNPSADAKGYVKTPNVDPLIEAMDMRDAQRAYEANLNVIETARAMDQRTLDLLKR